MSIVLTFYLGNIGQENVFYDILERKNAFLGYKKKKFKKSKNWHFSNGVNPWFWSKNGHFSNFFLLGNIGLQEPIDRLLRPGKCLLQYSRTRKRLLGYKVSFFRLNTPGKWLLRYSRTKNAILGYKNNIFKKSKNCHFSKGGTHGFGPKMAIFPTFFFR